MKIKRIFGVLAAAQLIFILGAIAGEDDSIKKYANNAPGLPGMFSKQFNAIGIRLKTRGKEKTIYTGQLFYKGGKSSKARIIHQYPGLVRLEGFKDQGGILSFDGERSYGVASGNDDEALIEAFSMDFPEGLLASLQRGAAVRLIGRGLGPDPRIDPDYKGSRLDVYEIVVPVRCRQERALRRKLYHFDSQTGFLQSVRYADESLSPPAKIEMRFSVWGNIEGSAYPAYIEYFKNGELVFTFIAETIQGEASSDKASFR